MDGSKPMEDEIEEFNRLLDDLNHKMAHIETCIRELETSIDNRDYAPPTPLEELRAII